MSENKADDQLPAAVIDALQRGNAIEAIKLLRQSSGLGLKEAKSVVDQHVYRRTGARIAVKATRMDPRALTRGLSPGEVPRSGNAFGLALALAVAVAVAAGVILWWG